MTVCVSSISMAPGKDQLQLSQHTPGGICRPQKTAPFAGTTLGILPGTPNEKRRDSLTTAR
jgi:hypothetical protein